ncbi:MAG: response regulator [Candidatus Thermoplasmatota archaeon]|nr:response regulator [Candidatus Thermoplasmatota archaeon]
MDKKTMLLVTNNPEDEQLIMSALKKNDIMGEIVIAKDGAEALDYMFGTGAYSDRDMSIMPQVVLLDLDLPETGGLEVLRSLRDDESTKLIPVVVLTTSDKKSDLSDSYISGASSYIRKPLDFEQLTQTVLYWLVLNEPPPQ